MRFLPATTLFLAAPLLAQQFPEAEPNDTPAQAQVVALGSQINCNLVAGESDWYSFATPGGYHGISVTGGATVVTDSRMTLWDASGTTCYGHCDDAQNFCPSIWMDLPAGTYLVKIDGFGATSAGSYSLDISQPMSKPFSGAEVEPNDTIATANTVADGDQLLASLSPPALAVSADTVAAPVVVASYVVTSSTTTVITVPGLTLSQYNGVGYFVRFTSGVHAGLSRRVTSNSTIAITTEAWPSAPAAGDTLDVVTSSAVVLADTAVAGSTTAVINTNLPLTTNAFIVASTSHAVRFLTGVNAGQSRTITSNTATSITVTAFASAPAVGDAFIVVAGGGTSSVAPAGALVAGQYNDQRSWLRCISGANAGQSRCILSNTAAYIALVATFTNAPAPGDAYVVDQYDSDTYRIDVTAPKAEVVFSITDGTLPWVSGWSYEVLDSLGVRINGALLGTNLADSSQYNARVSSFRVWPTGTYYVRVFQRRTTFVTTATTVAYGTYRFEVKIKGMGHLGTLAETEAVGGPNTNNTAATAIALTPGQTGVGNITNTAGGDTSDWWGPLTVTTQTLVSFQVSAAATATPLADSTLNLRQLTDPVLGTTAVTAITTGNILEAANLNPRGSFNLLLPGTTYYLEVLSPGAAANQGGDYLLEVSALDAPTYSVGNWFQATANATGCGTAGVPTISRVQGGATGAYGELPIIGETLVLRTTNLNGAGNLGLMLVGLSGPLGPSGAPAGSAPSIYNPQPLDISFLGAPGCSIHVNPLLVDVMFGDPTGTADYVLQCPGNPALAGFTLFLQPCKWDFATPVNAFGIQPGNWARVIFGTRVL